MAIKILSALVANQIAAGEVVERPVSVVKEMVENALDAGSTKITVEITNGGRTLIRITDNGSGIPKDELILALTRYATSKIGSLEDLECIASFGFRGEALASISSVSRLTLISKTKDESNAWQIHVEGALDNPIISPSSYPDGTTFLVEDLFFNTPARRRFLKSDKTEFSHIQDVVGRLAVVNTSVSFRLIHNGKDIYNFAQASTEEQKIKRYQQIVGRDFCERRIPVSASRDGLSVEGFVLPAPDETDSSPEIMFIFLNGRIVKDKNVIHAVRQAYTEVYGREVKSNFMLFLAVDPGIVDVNVHPAKQEVRFQNPRFVHDLVVLAVSSALTNLTGTTVYEIEKTHSYGSENDNGDVIANTNEENFWGREDRKLLNGYEEKVTSSEHQSLGYGRTSSASQEFCSNSYTNRFGSDANYKDFKAYNDWITSAIGNESSQSKSSDTNKYISTPSNYIVYGVFENFLCLGFENKLYRVDLLKLERKNLEVELDCDNPISSLLLLPVEISITNQQSEDIAQHLDFLTDRGFTVQVKGRSKSNLQIIAVPRAIRRFSLSDICSSLFETKNWYSNRIDFMNNLIAAVHSRREVPLVDAIQYIEKEDLVTLVNDLDLCRKIEVSEILTNGK